MPESLHFQFGPCKSSITFWEKTPRPAELSGLLFHGDAKPAALVVCDENTAPLAKHIFGDHAEAVRTLQLPAGEGHKSWASVEAIIHAAKETGNCLDRGGLFIGMGGGVVCDCTAFAASMYMRGARLALIPTTLLCMADAAVGGKTGINLAGVKNLAGTFYPAENIIIIAGLLATLPHREWKSGMAEIIKAAIIDEDPAFFCRLQQLPAAVQQSASPEELLPFIKKAILVKGRIVENDPFETSENGRVQLNLGHTFGHALESAMTAGQTHHMPGTLNHGEAVAWGIAKSCELGLKLGITPPDRAQAIADILNAWGFDTSNVFQKGSETAKQFREALLHDKKKKNGKLRFVVPAESGVAVVEENNSIKRFIEQITTKNNS